MDNKILIIKIIYYYNSIIYFEWYTYIFFQKNFQNNASEVKITETKFLLNWTQKVSGSRLSLFISFLSFKITILLLCIFISIPISSVLSFEQFVLHEYQISNFHNRSHKKDIKNIIKIWKICMYICIICNRFNEIPCTSNFIFHNI